jgi:hypothetical protein
MDLHRSILTGKRADGFVDLLQLTPLLLNAGVGAEGRAGPFKRAR